MSRFVLSGSLAVTSLLACGGGPSSTSSSDAAVDAYAPHDSGAGADAAPGDAGPKQDASAGDGGPKGPSVSYAIAFGGSTSINVMPGPGDKSSIVLGSPVLTVVNSGTTAIGPVVISSGNAIDTKSLKVVGTFTLKTPATISSIGPGETKTASLGTGATLKSGGNLCDNPTLSFDVSGLPVTTITTQQTVTCLW